MSSRRPGRSAPTAPTTAPVTATLPASGPALVLALASLCLMAGVTAHAAAPPADDGMAGDDPACAPVDRMPLEGRASPYDSVQVALAGGIIKLCYGSPSLRGRTMLGGSEVPFGRLWRFGANEPTTLHTSVPLSVGGVQVPPGSVALYVIPDADRWEVFISGSTTHWGLRITPEVRAQEVGSFHIEPQVLEEPVETMTFRFEEAGTRSAALVMEWQTTRLAIPVTVTAG